MTLFDYSLGIGLAIALFLNLKAIGISKRMQDGFEITIDEDEQRN